MEDVRRNVEESLSDARLTTTNILRAFFGPAYGSGFSAIAGIVFGIVFDCQNSITVQDGSDYDIDESTLDFPVIHFKLTCSEGMRNQEL
jgi:hypothetical protein